MSAGIGFDLRGFPKGRRGSAPAPALESAPGGLTHIERLTAADDVSLDFIDPSMFDGTYRELGLVLTDIVLATDAVSLDIKLSNDAGSTFKDAFADYRFAVNGVVRTGTKIGAAFNDAAHDMSSGRGVPLNGLTYFIGNGGNENLFGEVQFPIDSGLESHFWWTLSFVNSGLAESHGMARGAGALRSYSGVDAIRLIATSGNITSGHVDVWGRV